MRGLRWFVVGSLLIGAAFFPLFDEEGPLPIETAAPGIAFRVLGPDGRVPRGAELTLEGADLPCRFARPDARGHVVLPGETRPDLLYRLRARAPGLRPLAVGLRGDAFPGGDDGVIRLWRPIDEAWTEKLRRRCPGPRGRSHLWWSWSPPSPSTLGEGPRQGVGWPSDLAAAGRLTIRAYRGAGQREEAWCCRVEVGRQDPVWKELPRFTLATGLAPGVLVSASQDGESAPGFGPPRRLRTGAGGVLNLCDLRVAPEMRAGPLIVALRWSEGGRIRRRRYRLSR